MKNKKLRNTILKLNAAKKKSAKMNKRLEKHFFPLLKEAANERDHKKFGRILDQCPDCTCKTYMYQFGYETGMLK